MLFGNAADDSAQDGTNDNAGDYLSGIVVAFLLAGSRLGSLYLARLHLIGAVVIAAVVVPNAIHVIEVAVVHSHLLTRLIPSSIIAAMIPDINFVFIIFNFYVLLLLSESRLVVFRFLMVQS